MASEDVAGAAGRRAGAGGAVSVGPAADSNKAPHDGQNRLASSTSAVQDGQVIISVTVTDRQQPSHVGL